MLCTTLWLAMQSAQVGLTPELLSTVILLPTRLSAKRKAEEILPQSIRVRTSKYLNNLIEQDHRRIKQRIYPMLGFNRYANAAITISGIELAQKIRKGQFDIVQFSHNEARLIQIWEAVLAA